MVKDVLKMDNIVFKLIEDINGSKDTDDYKFSFNVHELSALQQVAYEVYDSFVDHEEKGEVFTPEVNNFLDNLKSAITKLNS